MKKNSKKSLEKIIITKLMKNLQNPENNYNNLTQKKFLIKNSSEPYLFNAKLNYVKVLKVKNNYAKLSRNNSTSLNIFKNSNSTSYVNYSKYSPISNHTELMKDLKKYMKGKKNNFQDRNNYNYTQYLKCKTKSINNNNINVISRNKSNITSNDFSDYNNSKVIDKKLEKNHSCKNILYKKINNKSSGGSPKNNDIYKNYKSKNSTKIKNFNDFLSNTTVNEKKNNTKKDFYKLQKIEKSYLPQLILDNFISKNIENKEKRNEKIKINNFSRNNDNLILKCLTKIETKINDKIEIKIENKIENINKEKQELTNDNKSEIEYSCRHRKKSRSVKVKRKINEKSNRDTNKNVKKNNSMKQLDFVNPNSCEVLDNARCFEEIHFIFVKMYQKKKMLSQKLDANV